MYLRGERQVDVSFPLGCPCGPCEYWLIPRTRFDAASLAILQRLDGLEDLIRSSASGNSGGQARPTDHVSSFTTPKQPGSPALESPALERPDASVLCHINIETVLCWPIFGDLNLDRRLDLRYLLQSRNPDSEPPPISITLDFENVGAPKLLQRFFEEVHIYNPVLEVETVEEYVIYARFNGLGWDAPSCLLVSAITSFPVIDSNPMSRSPQQASRVCPGLNICDSEILRANTTIRYPSLGCISRSRWFLFRGSETHGSLALQKWPRRSTMFLPGGCVFDGNNAANRGVEDVCPSAGLLSRVSYATSCQ